MQEKEKLIKEKRTILATKNGLIGPNGKLGCIVMYLGQKIMEQGSSGFGYEASYLPDPEEYIMEEEWIRDASDDEVTQIGWLFDGLSWGMHLEIKYVEDEAKLSVYYKGNLVYCEMAGDLQAYAPSQTWESLVDKLYEKAKTIRKDEMEEEKELRIIKGEKKKQSFLEKLKRTWGNK